MPQLFDTHAHLQDEQLFGDLDSYLDQAEQSGVGQIVCVATDLETSHQAIQIADLYPTVCASVGIHPNHTHEAKPGDWQQICELTSRPHVVALGETGLDGYWDFCPMDQQRDMFRNHLDFSRRSGLPVIIHMRDCQDEMLAVLSEAAKSGPINGIMHSFNGDWPMAEQCLLFGLHISFAGMVTYKKSDELREIAARIPDDRILVETDSPYLSPEPNRSTRPNHPAMVRHTARRLAELRGIDEQSFGEMTTANARRLFGV